MLSHTDVSSRMDTERTPGHLAGKRRTCASNLKLLASVSDNEAPCFKKRENLSGSKMHPGDGCLCPV